MGKHTGCATVSPLAFKDFSLSDELVAYLAVISLARLRAQLCRLRELAARVVTNGFAGLLSEQLNDQCVGTDLALNPAGIKDAF